VSQQQIAQDVRKLFTTPRLWAHHGRKLVFWYDPEGAFAETVAALDLSADAEAEAVAEGVNVAVLVLEQRPFFEKYYLLHEHPEQDFLLYAPFARPADEDNWLLDLERSGLAFSADRAAMVFRELGLHTRALEDYVRQHIAFFDNQRRVDRLLEMHVPADSNRRQLRLAMMCAALGLRTADAEALLRRVLLACLDNQDVNEDGFVPDFDGDSNHAWQTLKTLFSQAELWQVVADALYYRSDKPSLRQLYIQLAVTHAVRNLAADTPQHWQWAVLERPAAAYVFVDNWLKHRDDAAGWQVLSRHVGADLRLEDVTDALEPAAYARVDTFEHFARAFIRAVVLHLGEQNTDYGHWRDLLQACKTGFWYDQYQHYYAALEAAMDFLERHQPLDMAAGLAGLGVLETGQDAGQDISQDIGAGNENEAVALFERYSQDLYQLDGAYRRYVVAREAAGGDLLKQVDGLLKGRYVRGWLEPLARLWSDALTKQPLADNQRANSQRADGDTVRWQLPGVALQWQFFERTLYPYLVNHEREKVFVIISDALRYDVAASLRDQLLPDVRGDATLTPMLGVLPSRTNVGMAALLPGKRISINPNNMTVSKDGASTQGKDAREQVWKSSGFDTVVLTADELTSMSRDEGRDAIKAARLVVIYHDTIDKMGENDESKVLAACDTAIDELVKLVKRVCNALNGINVYITADHGFVYQEQALEDADKINLTDKENQLEVKRRHVLGRVGQPAPAGSLGFAVPCVTLEADNPVADNPVADNPADNITTGLRVYAPREMQRYALQGGGGQYVHGGASLQEITVPLLHYKHVRATKGGQGASRKVNAQVIASSRRVTNTLFSVTVWQLDAVDERVRPRTVELALYDAQGRAVTDVATVRLDKTTGQATAREHTVRLTIAISNPDRGASYDLVMTDSEDGTEVLREAWSISLAFSDDFGEF
jgi:uncharacterized protein (TIGR02687 family)